MRLSDVQHTSDCLVSLGVCVRIVFSLAEIISDQEGLV